MSHVDAMISAGHNRGSGGVIGLSRMLLPGLGSNRITVGRDTNFYYKLDAESVFRSDFISSRATPLSLLEEAVKSELLLDFANDHGVEGGSIEMNPFLSVDSYLYKAFVNEGTACVGERAGRDGVIVQENREAAQSKLFVRIVFHGTRESNIESILRNGLDRRMRSRQAYGQGEYYANTPAMPVRYCQGGKKMLVFAVITTEMDVKTKKIVVVQKSERQLPIATLSFERVSETGMKVANRFQKKLNALKDEKEKKEAIAQEAREKENIEKLLFRREYLAASDFYKAACSRNGGVPPSSWVVEMAIFVRYHIRNDEEVDIYFPNLPPRPCDGLVVDMLNVDECNASAKAARDQFEAYQKKNKVPQNFKK